ncbi:glycosyltransferase [Rhizobium sp. RAF56]|uniref:glycosyltransferase n=1 Tax=Rhizobium sp. RAF56 TaxID=3233062 RepID=UPI003F9A7002
MNILFVSHNHLTSNSGIHVSNLAHGISELGADVAVAVPDGLDNAVPDGHQYATTSYSDAVEFRFADGMGADLIHAWTPRQHVAEATRKLAKLNGCRYVVHLEDNEYEITAAHLGLSVSDLLAGSAIDSTLPIPGYLARPDDMLAFLRESAGVTALIDRLLEFKPGHLLGLEVWPAAEEELFSPKATDSSLRNKLGIDAKKTILVYNGNVHPANVSEVRSLYLAVAALARKQIPIVLVRLGEDTIPVLPEGLKDSCPVITLPFQPRESVPAYLALADVLVQPGRVNDFNAYRFPSKLPEFFAMGRPVILPATNIGLRVEDGKDAILTRRGDAIELAEKIMRVVSDKDLSARLAQGARDFYHRTLSWKKSATSLINFYQQVNQDPRLDDLGNDVALKRVARHYNNYRVPNELSYATVRDYSDGVDNLPALAAINQDLKDAQRPWILKAIIGAIPRGARLLEIGAGDPWVADLLVRLGYEVVIVDPYDGRDRGPAEFERIKNQFPNITFLRGLFPDALSELANAEFDCIYSISVLEHLPLEAVAPVFAGITKHTRTKDSPTIHAVDHVLLGNGAEEHFIRLKKMVECLGFPEHSLRDMLANLQEDPDTYFLSAEAHNRWRGLVPYDEFPMRRCVSIQLCAPVGRLSVQTSEIV